MPHEEGPGRRGVRALSLGWCWLAPSLSLSGLVYLEAAAFDFGPVESLDGSPCRIGPLHFNEPETSGTTGFPIHDHLGRGHRPVLGEEILQFGVVDAERKVSYVDIYTHQSFPFSVGPIWRLRRIPANGSRFFRRNPAVRRCGRPGGLSGAAGAVPRPGATGRP